MAILRLRYENGQFVPLDPVPELTDGDEIQVEWSPPAVSQQSLEEMLDRTRGLWADWDADVEGPLPT
jgi:predicted DNA-binding antitoxin AbrB/MazE fold protein